MRLAAAGTAIWVGLALIATAPASARDTDPPAQATAKHKPAAKHKSTEDEQPPAKKTRKSTRGHAPKAPAAAPLDEETVHVVRPGETLGGIANRARVPRVLIAEANALAKPWQVHAGQRLKLPRTRRHKVEAGETGFDIAYKYGVPYHDIAIANGLSAKSSLKPGQVLLIPTLLAPRPSTAAPTRGASSPVELVPTAKPPAAKSATTGRFTWPLTGKIRRGFSPRTSDEPHDGLDIVGAPGEAVRAVAEGTVIFAGHEPQSFGNLVVIQHADNWESAYGFLGKVTVAKGDRITPRERIGVVGHTGKATRDELHFELRDDNRPVDPTEHLPRR
jgi:LysM repeat protein